MDRWKRSHRFLSHSFPARSSVSFSFEGWVCFFARVCFRRGSLRTHLFLRCGPSRPLFFGGFLPRRTRRAGRTPSPDRREAAPARSARARPSSAVLAPSSCTGPPSSTARPFPRFSEVGSSFFSPPDPSFPSLLAFQEPSTSSWMRARRIAKHEWTCSKLISWLTEAGLRRGRDRPRSESKRLNSVPSDRDKRGERVLF